MMTGSSARKLRRGGINLLAGRAYSYQLFPLTYQELSIVFELDKILYMGCLPALWDTDRQEDVHEFLNAYTETYLKEEIQEEGIVRRIGSFARFLDVAGATPGEIVNYSTVSRYCGVSVKTVQEYYQILEDTFLIVRLEPWYKSIRKQVISHSKYFFFDLGVTHALSRMGFPRNLYSTSQFEFKDRLNTVIRGRRFEHWLILQVHALNHYYRLNFSFHFWKTYSGSEADLVISRGNKILIAIEIKSGDDLHQKDLSGLLSFKNDFPDVALRLVGTGGRSRELKSKILFQPWDQFLEELVPRQNCISRY